MHGWIIRIIAEAGNVRAPAYSRSVTSSPFLTIPREAVLEVDGKHFVYVVEAPNQYLKREVKVSNVTSDQVRILEGLTAGATYRDERRGA